MGQAPLPFVPGSELAGEVAALRDGVTAFAVGDRLIGSGFTGGSIAGAETSLTGDAPGFTDEPRDDFRLAPGSPGLGTASALPRDLATAHSVKNARDLGAARGK